MKPNSIPQKTLSPQFQYSIIEASSIGGTAYARLKEGKEGVVNGVFDSAINILLPGGIVSLVSELVERGPLNITLRLPIGTPRMSALEVRAGDRVKVHDSTLELGDRLLIYLGSTRIYSPKHKLTVPMLASNEIEANLEVMRKTALLYGNVSGFGALLALTPSAKTRAGAKNLSIFATAALSRIVRLEQAFRSEKKDALKYAVSELIGLGPGLTPSSDDFLAGLVLLCVLYAKNCKCASRACQLTAKVTAKVPSGMTTVLSEEYLRQAAAGRGNEPVMRLCVELLTGGRDSVARETKRVLQIGESSGTDTVLGILLGTMLCIGKQSSLAQRNLNGH